VSKLKEGEGAVVSSSFSVFGCVLYGVYDSRVAKFVMPLKERTAARYDYVLNFIWQNNSRFIKA
jgi:hypothetical protein